MIAVIISGSRDWSDRDAIEKVLVKLAFSSKYQLKVVIHGDWDSGADRIAREIIERHPELRLQQIRMPPQWQKHGKAAGPMRNAEMITLARTLQRCGYDIEAHCFPLPRSRGTVDLMTRARNMGITIHNHGELDE